MVKISFKERIAEQMMLNKEEPKKKLSILERINRKLATYLKKKRGF